MQLGTACVSRQDADRMLPATLQFIIAMIACAISERMQRKLDYTQEEVRVLKEVGGDHRQRTDGIHRGSAASSGRGGQGVEPGRAVEVLPDREAGDGPGVVPAGRSQRAVRI